MVTARRHMCVTGHYLATEAGFAMLEAGGNAVGVVPSDQVQFSGVTPMLAHLSCRRRRGG